MKTQRIDANWRIHTPNLLNEVLKNPGTSILLRPLQMMGHILAQVGERAAQLNDPILNELMCRLTIYSAADPDSPDYDPRMIDRAEKQAVKYRKTLKTTKEEAMARLGW